ncbi:MAG: hypothetical protein IJN79_11735 [Clostridia bacterium]|nr:hypothetical protein [Clostridia bacterium]MBQ2949084.1 hypothetical protein [Clostridia bacterium]MBQ4609472.1 hypothetical protein [Clostridia bacterium]MBQ7053451.1 hypothetical protein [Clostridia bacterium]
MMANLIANLPMLLCVLLGAALIIVEVFLPGFGLPGISGMVLIGAGVLLAAMHYGMLTAVGILLVVIAVLAVLISWVLRAAARGGMGRSELFLDDKQELEYHGDMQVLVGRTGKTGSVLRPAGIGDFDGVRLNVVTEGDFVERDMPIEIISVDGARIVVRQLGGN